MNSGNPAEMCPESYVHVYLLVARFRHYDIVTQWQTVNNVPRIFPDVELCDSSEYSKIRMEKSIISSDKYSIAAGTLAKVRAQSLWHLAMEKDLDNFGLYNSQLNSIVRKTMQSYAVTFDLGHHKQDSAVLCYYNGKRCSLSNFTEKWHLKRGNCIRFQPRMNETSGSGRSHGLSLLLFANDRYWFAVDAEKLGTFSGFYLSLSEPGHIAPFNDAMELPVGYASSISVQSTLHERVSGGKNGCARGRRSIAWTYHGMYGRYRQPFFMKYDKLVCQWLSYQLEVQQRCGCYADSFSIPVSNVTTYWSNHYCSHVSNVDLLVNSGYQRLNHTHVYIGRPMNVTISQFDRIFTSMNKRLDCREHTPKEALQMVCPDPCFEMQFSTQFVKRQWPDKSVYATNLNDEIRSAINESKRMGQFSVLEDIFVNESFILLDDEIIRRSFLLVDVYRSSTDVMLAQESLVYPITNMFSDFGGALGLWIGCSVISIAQFIWRCFAKASKWKQLKKHRWHTIKLEAPKSVLISGKTIRQHNPA